MISSCVGVLFTAGKARTAIRSESKVDADSDQHARRMDSCWCSHCLFWQSPSNSSKQMDCNAQRFVSADHARGAGVLLVILCGEPPNVIAIVAPRIVAQLMKHM